MVEGAQTSLNTDLRPFPFHFYNRRHCEIICFQADQLSILLEATIYDKKNELIIFLSAGVIFFFFFFFFFF